jgi:hypothetical protein
MNEPTSHIPGLPYANSPLRDQEDRKPGIINTPLYLDMSLG